MLRYKKKINFTPAFTIALLDFEEKLLVHEAPKKKLSKRTDFLYF